MKESCIVEIKGHILDSLTLPKILDTIIDEGGNYEIEDIEIGKKRNNLSYAKLKLSAEDKDTLENIVSKITRQGAEPVAESEILLEKCPKDKTLPEKFYASTNLKTEILYKGKWIKVDDTAMDCAVVVDEKTSKAFCRKISQIKKGDKVVVGFGGVKVHPLKRREGKNSFAFMSSDFSAEKPKSMAIKKIAQRMIEIKEKKEGKILFVMGPAVIHTKSQEPFIKLIESGFVDVLFSGNALAVHDLEAAFFGTSLGVSFEDGKPISGGHSHHLRAINKINHIGSIRKAVETGILNKGIMYTLIKNKTDYILAGSIRDDGPLPEVITDTITAQNEMRKRMKGVKMCIMLGSMLHSIAVGNLLPAEVETVCVDINSAVVTKLSDRGSVQAIGLVTDVESFLKELVRNLSQQSGKKQ